MLTVDSVLQQFVEASFMCSRASKNRLIKVQTIKFINFVKVFVKTIIVTIALSFLIFPFSLSFSTNFSSFTLSRLALGALRRRLGDKV